MDWTQIKAEYIAGGISYRRLAQKYGVSFVTLSKIAKREKWCDLRRQQEDRTTTNVIETIVKENTKRTLGVIDMADKLLVKMSELMDAAPLDTQSFKQLTSALKDLRDIKGIKSEGDIREQEARIAKLQKEIEESDGDTEIKVILEGDLAKYSK